ncbi:hypothetical protein Tco_1465294, partial [Tanacetum coccineum]
LSSRFAVSSTGDDFILGKNTQVCLKDEDDVKIKQESVPQDEGDDPRSRTGSSLKQNTALTTIYYRALMEALIADDDDDEGPPFLAGSNQGGTSAKSEKTRFRVLMVSAQTSATKVDEQSSKKPRESDASASKRIQLLPHWDDDIPMQLRARLRNGGHRITLTFQAQCLSSMLAGWSGVGVVEDRIHDGACGLWSLESVVFFGRARFGWLFRLGEGMVIEYICWLDVVCLVCWISVILKMWCFDDGVVIGCWAESVVQCCVIATGDRYGSLNEITRVPMGRIALLRDVISVKVFEKYGYHYLREIILRRADYQEYKISEKDFKNLHPNDFEDMFLLNIQEKLNHLPKTDKTRLHTAVNMWIRNLVIRNRVGDLQLRIESYQTKINLERPNWDAADYYFKEDYTIVPKPRAVVYRDRNDQRKLMRLNELHKFSDGTLTRVMEKLDHMLKTFICTSTIRAWRLGSGQRMTREEAKTSSLQSRKDYRSEGSIEV